MKGLEELLGYHFRDPSLLKLALIHRSRVNESGLSVLETNERLEFLGDAALGLVVAEFLYECFPNQLEGDLTKRRAVLVNLNSLADRAESIRLADFVLTGGGDLLSGGSSRRTILGRSYEALLGAIYLDGSIGSVRQVLLPWLEEAISDPDLGERSLDNKSRLQQFTAGKLKTTPEYELMRTSGPEHEKWFEVEVRLGERILGLGEGSSIRRAEQVAAGKAYNALREEDFVHLNQDSL